MAIEGIKQMVYNDNLLNYPYFTILITLYTGDSDK